VATADRDTPRKEYDVTETLDIAEEFRAYVEEGKK
jgi:hypothetical protein